MTLKQWEKILSPEAYKYAMQKYKRNRDPATDSVADVESTVGNESLGSNAYTKIDTPVCISIHSKRHRLADPDGISAKAAIDGLRYCGILPDDTAADIAEIKYTQEKADNEETIIKIKTIDIDS